ncbi:tektin-1 [Frankliniella occidentalis]|uniref:Tektin n=1 Tax=Frankliniella occidentalis TaxID=133901 RepID=A0A6J1TLA4_FRAOC|nr:tektin-1 [Frankliniella occidentalis]
MAGLSSTVKYPMKFPVMPDRLDNLQLIPPPPSRFTLSEWYLNNTGRYRAADDQQQLADRILEEGCRMRGETEELVKTNKDEVDHRIEEKLKNLQYRQHELNKQRKHLCVEIDALDTYMDRMYDCLDHLCKKLTENCKKCINLREGRLGIDLVFDDVDRELTKEFELLKGVEAMLTRMQEQTKEQIRQLKASRHLIDRELHDLDAAIKIDEANRDLRESSLNLSLYQGNQLHSSDIVQAETDMYSQMNMEQSAKRVNDARMLKSYIDTLLTQLYEDSCQQGNAVNESFRRRIDEIKEAKTKLEQRHHETARQANEMTRNITALQKAIQEKEGFMALAHTRLGNRAQRLRMELCRDDVETSLISEVMQIQAAVTELQNQLAHAEASLRYLLKMQIQLEEDINVKTNSLKIDEVECLTVRDAMDYHKY